MMTVISRGVAELPQRSFGKRFLAVTNGYWEMTMVVERGPEPMGEKGR